MTKAMTPIERARELLKSDRLHGTVVMSGLDAAVICRALIAAEERAQGWERALGACADSAIAYDEAIHGCANDPERMASFCTAQGDDLDALYLAWLDAARDAKAALAKGKE